MNNKTKQPQTNKADLETLEPMFIAGSAEQPKAIFIFAHGAGADMSHTFLETVSAALVKNGISVLRFNFPYMIKRSIDGKRRPPDRMLKLLGCYQTYLENYQLYFDHQHQGLPVFIGGKSMGSRVAAMLAAGEELESPKALPKFLKGLICLGYPFHPNKKPDKLRLSPLMAKPLPSLIVQGERDALGSEAEIASYGLPDSCTVKFLADGDHDFKPRVKSGFTHQQHISEAVALITSFIESHIDG